MPSMRRIDVDKLCFELLVSTESYRGTNPIITKTLNTLKFDNYHDQLNRKSIKL